MQTGQCDLMNQLTSAFEELPRILDRQIPEVIRIQSHLCKFREYMLLDEQKMIRTKERYLKMLA